MTDEIYKIVYTTVYVVMIIWFLWSIITMTIKYKKESRNMDLKFKREMKYKYIQHKLEMKIFLDKEKRLNKKFKDLLTK